MSAPGFCLWWVGCYTRGLPAEARQGRRDELESDLYEHAADALPHQVGTAMVGRTVRGMADDLLWRLREGHEMRTTTETPSRIRTAWAAATQAWFAPLAVLIGLFNLTLAAAILFDSENNKMPGQVVGPVVITGLTTLMFLGLHRRSRAATRARASSMVVRRPASALRADLLILAGTLPAIAMWWLIIPAIVAVAVIAGVLGTGRGAGAPQTV